MSGKSDTPSIELPEEKTPLTATEMVKKFLDENNIVLTLAEPRIERVSDGSLVLKQPEIIVNFKNGAN